MLISIRHCVRYRYDSPVFLEPHTVRLFPRLGASVRLVASDLQVDPLPWVRADNLDKEGNTVFQTWFEGPTSHLTVDSRVTVETLVTDPFRFLATDPAWPLPYVYPPGWGPTLAPYRRPPDAVPDAVRELALAAANDTRRDQLTFPPVLAQRMHDEFVVVHREEGPPRPAPETAGAKTGACRDLAVLFVECCRAMGLAARFVSGYAVVADSPRPDLHAWAEVYLRGGGWRGFDPSLGLAVSDRHVVLAAAAEPDDAAPVSGTFRGDCPALHPTHEMSIETR